MAATLSIELPEISVGPSDPSPAGNGTPTTPSQLTPPQIQTPPSNIAPTVTTPNPNPTGDGPGSSTDAGTAGAGGGSAPGTGNGTGDGTGGGGSPDMGASGGNGQATFYDNALNGYRQVAYHFRLYCAGDTGTGTQIIVAETAKTGFNIREVHIDALVAPNPQTHNTRATNLTLVITEPMGVAFLDALYVAAAASGVKNWNTCMYMLDLWFVGYNEDGSVASPIGQNMPNNGKITWRIAINDIDTVLETSGAVYTIKALVIHDSVLVPEWIGTQSNLTISGKTVKEHLDNLASAVNKKIIADYKAPIVNFSFKFHGGGQTSGPDPSQFKLKAKSTSQYDPYRLFSMQEKDRDVATANINRGKFLTQTVDELIGSTEDGQSLAWYGKTGGDLTKQPDSKFAETIHYGVYPEVTYTGEYNQTYGQYHKKVVLHVKPYKTQMTIRNSQEITAAGQAAWSAAAARTHKKYEYIFTGLNTEVVTFEPKFRMLWTAALPRFAGWEQTNEMVEHHAIYDKVGTEKFKAYKQSQADAASGNQQVQNAGATAAGTLGTITSGLNPLANAFAPANVAAATTAASTALQGTGLTGDAAQAASAAAVGGITGAQGSVGSAITTGTAQTAAGNILASSSEANLKAQQAALDLAQKQSGQYANVASGSYAEDLLGSGSSGSLPYTPLSLAQAASAATRANGTGFLGQRGTIGRSVYGAMLDQLYDPLTYCEIDLTVRGDPFWLGGQYENVFQDVSQDKNAADFSQGDTCFALVFKYPYGLDEATGQPTFKPQNTFNGAYRAVQVTHDFVEGKFTQTIHALRMVKVRPDDVNKAVAGASTSSGNTGTAGSSTSTGTLGTDGSTTNSGTITPSTAVPSTTPSGVNVVPSSLPSFAQSPPTGTVVFPMTIGNSGGSTGITAFSPVGLTPS